jgi:hypothetical protein
MRAGSLLCSWASAAHERMRCGWIELILLLPHARACTLSSGAQAPLLPPVHALSVPCPRHVHLTGRRQGQDVDRTYCVLDNASCLRHAHVLSPTDARTHARTQPPRVCVCVRARLCVLSPAGATCCLSPSRPPSRCLLACCWCRAAGHRVTCADARLRARRQCLRVSVCRRVHAVPSACLPLRVPCSRRAALRLDGCTAGRTRQPLDGASDGVIGAQVINSRPASSGIARALAAAR